MTAPTVVKVVARARLNPLQGRVRRIVALSDGSDRMERWDFHQGAWVTWRQGLGTGDRPDRRTPRHADTDLRDHGFMVVHRWELR